jgi:osmotically-inducible protein OsmY
MFKKTLATPTADIDSTQELLEIRQETQISTAYSLSRYLRANDLKVSVRAGTATISGVVAEDVNKDLAKQIALGVDGVKSVNNRIEIVPHFAAAASTHHRNFGDIVDDATVTSAVKSKLAWSRFADNLIVDVSTSRGKVKLRGTATNAATRDAAGRLAMNTFGAHSVSNELVVEASKSTVVTSIGADFADTWITMKVKSTFMYSTHVAASDIAVSTASGVVKLAGKLDSEAEMALAIELAGNVRGVKRIDSSALEL